MVRPNETRQYVHDPRRYQSRLRLPSGVQEVSVWQEPRAERGFFFAGRSAQPPGGPFILIGRLPRPQLAIKPGEPGLLLRCRAEGAGYGQTQADIISAAIFSATMMVGMLVFPRGTVGIIEASATRRPGIPRTRPAVSTTAWQSFAAPMRQVPTGWNVPATFWRMCSASASSSSTSAARSTRRSASVEKIGPASGGTRSMIAAMTAL